LHCNPDLKEIQVHQRDKAASEVSRGPTGDTSVVCVYRTRVGYFWDAQLVFVYETQYRSAAALFRVAAVVQAGARSLCAAAKWLDAWLEKRRVAAAALRDLGTMSERELLDIGLTRVDVHRVAWGASDRIYSQV
jgi:uncharacterized protein YjiS (DUF1127 family)